MKTSSEESRMAGDVAVVTAAGQGIGRAIAEAMARAGARVIAADLQEDKLASLAGEVGGKAEGTVEPHRLDVTDAAAVERFAKGVPTATVLVNGVGWVHHGSVLGCTEADWERSLEVNVTSMFRMIRTFLPGMREAGYGSIINIASVASSEMGVPNRCAYGTTKAAVIGLTKSVAADFVAEGIRCNAICPGTVQSPSLDDRIAAFDDPVAARKDFIARQPMGRLGTADEIAALAVHLGSRESAYTTGTTHVIDGGMTL